jgi:hypothetical protein
MGKNYTNKNPDYHCNRDEYLNTLIYFNNLILLVMMIMHHAI